MISKAFVIAGKATFTVSNNSGKHYTYRVEQADDRYNEGEKVYFAKLLTGPDNTRDYTYVGMLDPVKATVRTTQASRLSSDSESIRVLNWALDIIFNGRDLPEGYKIQHDGCCGKCRAPLTVPESIEAGLGPVCGGRRSR